MTPAEIFLIGTSERSQYVGCKKSAIVPLPGKGVSVEVVGTPQGFQVYALTEDPDYMASVTGQVLFKEYRVGIDSGLQLADGHWIRPTKT